ncbi:MAG: hypothetical protein JWN98_481 [Abditibacteriota bacterium]|nr:hypothetical protein [Abditibacteriota bacterium]
MPRLKLIFSVEGGTTQHRVTRESGAKPSKYSEPCVKARLNYPGKINTTGEQSTLLACRRGQSFREWLQEPSGAVVALKVIRRRTPARSCLSHLSCPSANRKLVPPDAESEVRPSQGCKHAAGEGKFAVSGLRGDVSALEGMQPPREGLVELLARAASAGTMNSEALETQGRLTLRLKSKVGLALFQLI